MHRSDTFISKNIGIQAVLNTLSETKNLRCTLLSETSDELDLLFPIYMGDPPPPSLDDRPGTNPGVG